MTRTARITLAAIALVSAYSVLPASAQDGGPYTVVETGRSYSRLQEAVNAIGDGMGTIRFASQRLADCAVQERGDILYIAAERGQAMLDKVVCEGKAALVLRGRRARIDGLVFAHYYVNDGNAAGIRLEKGDLAVSQSWFRDAQQAILTTNGERGSITIDKSTFSRLGGCASGGCSHSLYVGDYGSLTVTRSRFEQGRGGHYVKSRAAQTSVLNSSFDDSGGKGTNYMIDLSNGASGRIAGNVFLQGKDKENYSALITVAPEGKVNSSDGMVIEGNIARLAPGARSTTFVADWVGDKVQIGANTLSNGIARIEKRW